MAEPEETGSDMDAKSELAARDEVDKQTNKKSMKKSTRYALIGVGLSAVALVLWYINSHKSSTATSTTGYPQMPTGGTVSGVAPTSGSASGGSSGSSTGGSGSSGGGSSTTTTTPTTTTTTSPKVIGKPVTTGLHTIKPSTYTTYAHAPTWHAGSSGHPGYYTSNPYTYSSTTSPSYGPYGEITSANLSSAPTASQYAASPGAYNAQSVSNVSSVASLGAAPTGYTWTNVGKSGSNQYPTYTLEQG